MRPRESSQRRNAGSRSSRRETPSRQHAGRSVGIPHVERRSQAQLPPHAHREDATMHKHNRAGMRSGGFEDRAHARVRQGVTMHGGEQANTLHAAASQSFLHALDASGAAGLAMKKPQKRSGCGSRPRQPNLRLRECWRSARPWPRCFVQFRFHAAARSSQDAGMRQSSVRPKSSSAARFRPPAARKTPGEKKWTCASQTGNHPTEFASGLFQCMRPAAKAIWVTPATLLTPSFFISILR